MAGIEDYSNRTYGDQIAEVYDQYYPSCDPAAIVALNGLAGAGQALELGIGTGRVALPLSAAGVPVTGIDASEAMVRQLRSKPGGSDIPLAIGDFADVGVEGRFTLIYVVFNTFFNLLTQADQVRCFQNATVHLPLTVSSSWRHLFPTSVGSGTHRTYEPSPRTRVWLGSIFRRSTLSIK